MIEPINLIIEGLDRVGKSTLIEVWPDTHEKRKLGPPPTIPRLFYDYTGYWMRLHGFIPTQPLLWDRGHLSEIVYGGLYRPEWPNSLIRRWMGEQEAVLKRLENEGLRRTVVVYMYGNDSIMKEDERPNANKARERGRYLMVLNGSSLPHIKIASADGDNWRKPENMIDEILEKLKGL